MTYTQTTDADTASDVDHVARLIASDGRRVNDPTLDAFAAEITAEELRALYRDMMLTRRVDIEGVALQRQGQLGLWAPCRGQEAVQVGTAHALRSDDFVFTSYRELGVFVSRGAKAADYVVSWRGEEHSTFNPYDLNVATPQIIIGAQTLHAVGYAMGIQRDGSDESAVAYFGDGATSQGDVNEAMIFAASFTAPVVFVCSNNQWAISEPVGLQARHPLSDRAPGFGIPSMRVDGNDVLGCFAAMRWALQRTRSGAGPAYIEAVTYRMGPHTTSDDPTRYRDSEEVERWARRDPIDRFESLLRAEAVIDDGFVASVSAEADALAADMRNAALHAPRRAPLGVFDHVYAEPHSGLDDQRRQFAEYLDGFETEEAQQ
ncbi:pyruvate dehydrogenase (acetyl-transferring) E1 component subunit alpha [Microbacterium sp. C7(2022)]|uniref:pyruvate dehydrogenase (acetyl-transferring) E1 component subunit alpha n=1 Tax=Microbacterium sp. C7(2022) TaxID=2992759 RepID=UPI00237B6058|nr:pyruvate dehydrogenase (acetyl-transferring) E1 component subunit alpha [Microbacterium sp. C7(2022)]MDE0546843.1 pyruvate dehydrogenase (acetyl-transferring) E1 component subunit alpha [Microbacterium sp. C7(2022)]